MRRRKVLKYLAVTMLVLSAAPAAPQAADGKQRRAPACVALKVADANPANRCLVPGSDHAVSFKDCPNCPAMVLVPAGSFTMGSPDNEPGHSAREPRMRATIGKPFAVGRFAVTFEEWEACVAAGGCNKYTPSDEGWGRGKLPVINVNWQDAVSYTQWLSRKTGHSYRLLTEREREYVARAGTETPYWWGASIDLSQANYDIPQPASRPRDNGTVPAPHQHGPSGKTVAVDSYAANPWGFYNVHGNVWEWMLDCWREQGLAKAVPQGEAQTKCGERTARGGSWSDLATEARSANRIGFNATTRNALQGFRVARVLP